MPDPINLLRGWPSTTLLPASQLLTAATAVLTNPSISDPGLLYGPDEGYQPAREAIAAWLTTFYSPSAGPIPSERICITGGASQNLGNLLSVYTDPAYTRDIWIVAPAYFLAFRIFEDAGFAGRMRAVREDGEGLDLEMLERGLEESERRAEVEGLRGPVYKPERKRAKVYKHVIYCVPTFANPSSRTMSLERRKGLVRLARKFDALVVADDVYDVLQWEAGENGLERTMEGRGLDKAHLPRLVDVDRDLEGGAERDGADGFGNTCSNGSFSKIAGPGCRCGWAEGTKKFAHGLSQTGTTCSGGAPSQLTSTFMTHLLETKDLHAHIRTRLQPAYAQRYSILQGAIAAHLLPLGFTQPQPDRSVVGGFFVWLHLPSGLTATDLTRVCKEEEGVVVAPGSLFEVPGSGQGWFEDCIRLCFTWVSEDELEEGVRRVGKAAQKVLNGEFAPAGNGGGSMDGFK